MNGHRGGSPTLFPCLIFVLFQCYPGSSQWFPLLICVSCIICLCILFTLFFFFLSFVSKKPAELIPHFALLVSVSIDHIPFSISILFFFSRAYSGIYSLHAG